MAKVVIAPVYLCLCVCLCSALFLAILFPLWRGMAVGQPGLWEGNWSSRGGGDFQGYRGPNRFCGTNSCCYTSACCWVAWGLSVFIFRGACFSGGLFLSAGGGGTFNLPGPLVPEAAASFCTAAPFGMPLFRWFRSPHRYPRGRGESVPDTQ